MPCSAKNLGRKFYFLIKKTFVFQKPRGKPGPKPKTPKVKNEPKPTPMQSNDENDFVIGDLDDPFAMFFDNIVLLTDNDSDPICGPFLSLPSKKLYPDYYEDIEHPIALEQIRNKGSSHFNFQNIRQNLYPR